MRLGGADRYETSLLIAKYFCGSDNADYETAAVASGSNQHFADALAGACLQGGKPAPIILADDGSLAGINFLKLAGIEDPTILGGPCAVSYKVTAAMKP